MKLHHQALPVLLVVTICCLALTPTAWCDDARDAVRHIAPDAVSMLGATQDESLALFSAHGYWGRGKIVNVQGESFSKAYEAAAANKPGKPHNVQMQIKYTQPINKGDVLFIYMVGRAVDVGSAVMDVQAGPGSQVKMSFGRTWAPAYFAFKATAARTAEDKNNRLTAFIGHEKQKMQIGDVTILNLGPDVDLKTLPNRVPKPVIPLLRQGTEFTEPAPHAITGAVVDESRASKVIHVSPKGDDEAPGTEAAPLKTFRHALVHTRKHLKAGHGVRIVLHEGIYREGTETRQQRDIHAIYGDRLGYHAMREPLIIEAAPGAKVVFDGADLYPIDQWERAGQTDAGHPIYKRALPNDIGWDRKHYDATNPNKPLGYRMDMAFIDDQPLRQVMLEKYPDVPRRGMGRVGGDADYQGPIDPATALIPGTFGVVLHPADQKMIYICPSPEVDLNTAEIAVTARRMVLRIYNKHNTVVRGITFRHYGGDQNASPLFFIGTGKNKMYRNFMVDQCNFIWNNGTGFRYLQIDGITLRNSKFNYNGYGGESGTSVRNILVENCEANFNNWRGWWGGFTGWAVAGMKSTHLRDLMVRNYALIGNLAYGYWLDVDCQNNNFDGLFAAYNLSAGFYYEICDGPAMLENSTLAYNGVGALVQCSDNITMRNNIIVGNGQQIRMTHERNYGRPSPTRNFLDDAYGTKTIPVKTAALGRVTATNNLIVQTSPNAQSVAVRFQKDYPERRSHFFKEWLKINNNTYISTQGSAQFGPNDERHIYGRRILPKRDAQIDFTAWRNLTGQDRNSRLLGADAVTWSNQIPSLAGQTLPYPNHVITPEKMAEIEAFFKFAGFDINRLRKPNVFEREFKAEPTLPKP